MAAFTAEVTSMPVEVAPVAAESSELRSTEEELVELVVEESSELRAETELIVSGLRGRVLLVAGQERISGRELKLFAQRVGWS